MAEQKYQALVQASEWAHPTSEQSEIVAMQAKISNLNKQLTNKPKAKKTDPSPVKNKPKEKEKGKGKGKQRDNEYVIPAWKLEPPPPGGPQSKKGKDSEKTYYWCPNHKEKGMWVLHKPADCNVTKDSTNNPSLQQSAMEAIIDFTDEIDSDEEEE
jgi:hypothetical protein